MSTDIELVSQALAEFSAVDAGLQALRERYTGIVYAVATAEGLAEAKAARLALRAPRYEVERIRKSAKAPLLALGKKLDADAARITAEIGKLEGPIDQQIKVEEARKEAERQAKIAAEEKRVRDIQERIAELLGCQTLTPASGSTLIAEHIADLEGLPVDETFEEFRPQAADAKTAGLARLSTLHTAALAHEAEQARIKAERAELERLRAAQEEATASTVSGSPPRKWPPARPAKQSRQRLPSRCVRSVRRWRQSSASSRPPSPPRTNGWPTSGPRGRGQGPAGRGRTWR